MSDLPMLKLDQIGLMILTQRSRQSSMGGLSLSS